MNASETPTIVNIVMQVHTNQGIVEQSQAFTLENGERFLGCMLMSTKSKEEILFPDTPEIENI